MYQTILFDLDGTLTDSGQGILIPLPLHSKKWGLKKRSQII